MPAEAGGDEEIPRGSSTGEMIGRTSGRCLDHAAPGLDEGRGRELRKPARKARAHLAQHLRIRRRIQDALALEGRLAIERPARGCREGAEELTAHGDPHRLAARAECRQVLQALAEARRDDRMDGRVAVRDRVAAVGAAPDRDRGRPGLAGEQLGRRRRARDRVEHRELRHADAERAAEEPCPGAARADHGARRDAAVLGDDAGDAPGRRFDAAHGACGSR